MDEQQLTLDEELYYANHALIETCDCCGEYCAVFNYHDGYDYIVYNGIQFLCPTCRD